VTGFTRSTVGPVHSRRWLVRSLLVTLGMSAALIVLYLVLPAASHSDRATLIRMTIVLLLFFAALAYQLRSILRSDHPGIRAGEALIVTFVALVVAFSFGYLSMSHASGGNFTQHLDKVKSVYFTLTIITTVGFGDITPATDAARVVVCVQYLVDLFLIVGVARVFIRAAQHARSKLDAEPAEAAADGPAEA
jgi:voltage-gated potassium channel